MKAEKKSGKEKWLQYGLLILGIIIAAHLFLFAIEQMRALSGMASSTSTAAVQLEVLPINGTGGNVSDNLSSGGGGGRAARLDMEVSEKLIQMNIKKGEAMYKTLTIKNTGEITLTFFFSAQKGIINLDKIKTPLHPGESTNILLSWTPQEEGIFIDTIKISAGFIEKIIPVIITVESSEAEFSLSFDIDENSYVVRPGSEMMSTLKIGGLEGKMDIRFVIMDAAGRIIYEERERVNVPGEITIEKIMNIPSYLKEGGYIMGVIADYLGQIQIATQLFKVTETQQSSMEEPNVQKENKWGWILILVICGIALHAFMSKRMIKPLN